MAPKFITHTTTGNHSLICIIEKLYGKNPLSVSGLIKHFFLSQTQVSKNMSADSEKRKLSALKPSSRDGNRFKYLVRAQPNSTEPATLSSPGSDDDQIQDQNEPDEQQSHSQAHEALQSSAFCYKPGCLFVLRFYGPVNPMGSCRARSVYLTTHLLGRLSPLSG